MTHQDMLGLAVGAGSLMLGGVLKGATGAGAPVVVVPLLALLYDVPFAVAMYAVPNLVSNGWQAWHFRGHLVSRRLAVRLALTGLLGTVAGTLVLVSAPPEALLLTVAGIVFLYIAFRLMRPGWRLSLAAGERLSAPVGLVSEVLFGSTGLSAPVSLTFLNALKLERPAFIVTVSWLFLAMGLTQFPMLVASGVLDGPRLALSALAILPVFAGIPVGSWLVRYVSRETFDRVILALLAALAVRIVAGVLL